MIRVAKQEEVKHFDIKDLDANIHPYVVFGNEEHNPSFMPNKHGMEHLRVMAIMCGGQLHYGIWGDTSGGTSTGEASISLAKLCFPKEDITGDIGHSEKDVFVHWLHRKERSSGIQGRLESEGQ
ncbi:unnamed protein product [Penicillium viridicatum]